MKYVLLYSLNLLYSVETRALVPGSNWPDSNPNHEELRKLKEIIDEVTKMQYSYFIKDFLSIFFKQKLDKILFQALLFKNPDVDITIFKELLTCGTYIRR